MKLYAHADADCFYVSCERIRDPRLIGKPVGVLGNQGACVIAASYEMKAAGVDIAMPIWKAKAICPEGIFIKRDFRWYGLLSHAMQEVFKEYSDHVEYYSIDESFMLFDLDFDEAKKLAHHMQDRMLKVTGLPISVGFAKTRTLSKLGSKRNKPFGTLIINDKNREAILQNTSIQTVNGIGRKLTHKCHQLGIQTAWDYAQTSREVIKQQLNKPGEVIWYELQGHPVLSVETERPERKIVSRGGSIWGHYKDKAYIWGFLIRNLERFLTCLWDEDLEVRRLTTVLRTSDGRQIKHTQDLRDYTSDQKPLLEALRVGFEKAYQNGPTYSRVHIIGEPVRSNKTKQLNLFKEGQERSRKIKEIKATLNKRYGLFTIRNATTAYASEVFKDKISDFEIVDVADKHLF